MLGIVNARRQRVVRIVVAHLDRCLSQNRSAIDFVGDEVHRAARHAHPMTQRLADRIEPGKRRQQRGVDIEHTVGERAQELRVKPPHESGEHHKVDRAHLERVDPGALVLEPGAEASARNCERFDAGSSRAFERRSLGVVARQQHDRGTEIAACGKGRQGFEVGTLARR